MGTVVVCYRLKFTHSLLYLEEPGKYIFNPIGTSRREESPKNVVFAKIDFFDQNQGAHDYKTYPGLESSLYTLLYYIYDELKLIFPEKIHFIDMKSRTPTSKSTKLANSSLKLQKGK
jgi:hypothetical protein